MAISTQAQGRPAEFGWWVAESVPPEHQPVVGLETRLADGASRTWLVCASGVRRFDFRGGKLAGWGPPLSPEGRPESDEGCSLIAQGIVNGWLTDAGVDAGGKTVQASPPGALVAGLRAAIPNLEVPAPAGMSPHNLHCALYEIPTGVAELQALVSSAK